MFNNMLSTFNMGILLMFLGSNVRNRCSDTEMLDQSFVPSHLIPEKSADVFVSFNHTRTGDLLLLRRVRYRSFISLRVVFTA